MHALISRFHAVTRAQAEWLSSLSQQPIGRVVCMLTSADQEDTPMKKKTASKSQSLIELTPDQLVAVAGGALQSYLGPGS